MSKNDGGPAFPAEHFDLTDQEHGMSLRDYFAAHAPEPPERWRGGERGVQDVIDWCWHYADAMLAERAK